MKHKLEKYFPVVLGALLFMIFALYNGYPIVSGDTGVYLESGFKPYVPAERPIFYGLFVQATSFGATIWTTMFVQCLILSWLCTRFIKGLQPKISNLHLIALLLIISLGTILSWYAGQILPDIFTPILFLALYIYMCQYNSTAQKILLLAIIYVSVVVHFSHYLIATAFLSMIIGLSFIAKGNFLPMRKKTLQLLTLIVLCWLSLFTSNLIGSNGFVSSKASHVFFMGKLNESGVLKTYLDKACPIKPYKICAHKDNMPPVAWEFVWDEQNSPVFKTGGWEANKQEYKEIISDIASRPKYWPFLAYKSLEATLRQVILLNIDEGEERPWIKFEKDHPLYQTIQRIFPHEINEFAVSRQNIKTLNIVFYDEVYTVVLLLSTVVCLFCLGGDIKKKAGIIYLLLVLFLFTNAFVTATFGNVLSRLNSRAIGLLPMVNVVIIYWTAKRALEKYSANKEKANSIL